MNQILAMRIFVKVAEFLSFTIAAKELGVSAAVVTRNIFALEKHLGAKLVNRTTRCVSLTEAGSAYAQSCETILSELDSLDRRISETMASEGGSLRIAASALYADSELPAVLSAYHRERPNVAFDISVFERAEEIAPDKFDICFYVERRLRDSTQVCRSLKLINDTLVASPKYLSIGQRPMKPEQLGVHNIIAHSRSKNSAWEFKDGASSKRILVSPFLTTLSYSNAKAAIIAGLGIGRIPRELVDSEIQSGDLCEVLMDFEFFDKSRSIWMTYSKNPLMPSFVRGFVDFVVSVYREEGISELVSDGVC